MKMTYYSLFWSLGTVVVSGLVAYLVVDRSSAEKPVEPSSHHQPDSLHHWLHENLKITGEQDKVLHPIEHDFDEKEKVCAAEIKSAGLALAEVIRNEPENRAKVEAARKRLHQAQGKLQEMTLEHFFDMKQYLTAEQGEKLLKWTYDSLTYGNQR